MCTLGKRGKIYQITNNITNDVYVGSTQQALYKRLYKHKCEMDRGVESKLYDLMRALGKDKFKIELIEEYSYSDIDALRARELYHARERSTLNDQTARREQHPEADGDDTDTQPSGCRTERLTSDEYVKCLLELQREVRDLKTQLESARPKDREEEPQAAQKAEPEEDKSPKASEEASPRSPECFDISDDENDDLMTELAEGIPIYDLTDDMFEVLRGRIDDCYVEQIKEYSERVEKLGRHVSGNPRDAEAKQELEGYKRSLAKRVVHLRVDANNLGLDQPCLKLLDTIEKNARFNKKLNKKLLWDAKRYREEVPYDREEWLTEEVATT